MCKITFLLIGISLFTACSQVSEKYVVGNTRIIIDGTSVIYDFQPSDTIGVFPVGYRDGQPGQPGDIAYPINVPFILENNNWKPIDGDYLFTNEEKLDIYAYFPYDIRMGNEEGRLRNAEFVYDLSDQQQRDKIDLLWAKSTIETGTENIAALSFQHVFSKITIRLQLSNIGNPDIDLEIYNIKSSATVNLATGMATANQVSENITPVLINQQAGNFLEYEAIVPPQEIFEGTSLLYFIIDGEPTHYVTDRRIELESGSNYTFDLTFYQSPAQEL